MLPKMVKMIMLRELRLGASLELREMEVFWCPKKYVGFIPDI